MLPNKNKHPSASADPKAVVKPFQNPWSDPRLKTRMKIGPIADETDTPTRKHLRKNQQFIENPFINEFLCNILPQSLQ
jgi:hypothetical protein